MRRSIGRPARALLPLALGALILTGDGARVAAFALSVLVARLFSLCTAAAFQAVSGKVVSESRLRGNFLTALLLALVGGAAFVWAPWQLDCARLNLPEIGQWIALSGAVVMLSELFSDRLYALTDKLSAPLCDALIALLTAVGFIASRGDDRILFFFTLAALIACVIAGFGIGGIFHMRPGARVIREIPRALVRAWLPSAILIFFLVIGRDGLLGVFAAASWAFFSWAYAPVRRTENESGPVVILTTFAASVCVLVALFLPELRGAQSMPLLMPVFAACLMIAYGTATLSSRAEFALLSYTLATAIVGWHLTDSFIFGFSRGLPYIAAAAGVLAVVLILPDVHSALRLARMRKRRRRS